MNRSISVFSLVSLSTITGLLTLAPKVTAQNGTGQVEMTATVTDLCVFENELDGTLGVDPADLTTLDSALAANGITA